MSNCHICRNIFSTYVETCFQFCHISCIYFVQLISVCNRCESIDRTGVSYGHQLCTKDDYINNGHFIIIYCFPVCFVQGPKGRCYPKANPSTSSCFSARRQIIAGPEQWTNLQTRLRHRPQNTKEKLAINFSDDLLRNDLETQKEKCIELYVIHNIIYSPDGRMNDALSRVCLSAIQYLIILIICIA